ncbi:MAG: LPS assembly lipoprotein LptE [Planctomycetota bacterium]|nr:LPS assembly lipoprotein LptE [Planctomycetota bacterium]
MRGLSLRVRAAAFAALALALLALAGCANDPRSGYTLESTFDQGVRSIAVPVFENETYNHGIEIRLTEAIIKEMRRNTPWEVRSSGAATTLRGAVTGVGLRKLATNRDSGLVEELAVEIEVAFEWSDNRSGETLVAKRAYRGAGTFVPAHGVQERLATGEQAAIEALAQDIVSELRSTW